MKKFVRLLLIFALMFTISACGNNSTQETSDGQASETNQSAQFEGKTMNVVATSDEYAELFDAFTKETGAKVEFLSMSSGEVLSRVKAEGGKPMADLWFGGGLDSFMQAKADGLLEQYTAKGSEEVAPEYKDPEGYWYSKGLTVVGFIANNDVLAQKNLTAPASWDDLIKPEYKGEIIMSSPAISGTNYAAVKGLLDMYGDEGWAYLEKLNENIPFYGKRGRDPQEKTVAGEFAIGIIPVDKTAFDAAEENNLTVVYPENGIPWVPEGVAIFKGSENTDIAKAFLDFMFTPEAMEMIARLDGKDGAQMVVPDIKGYDLGLPKDKLIKQDLSTFGSQRTEILDKWNALTSNKETK